MTRREAVQALRELGQVAEEPHLGGWKLLLDGAWFGVWQRDRLWLRAGAEARAEHMRHGMMALQPNPSLPEGSFYEVPASITEAPDRLRAWVRRAAAAARP